MLTPSVALWKMFVYFSTCMLLFHDHYIMNHDDRKKVARSHHWTLATFCKSKKMGRNGSPMALTS
uniref:Uncharacterized protein n=1 Tax=Anguilla anguilla TaxID=7936 RepID=A0A0E9W7U3_ANGAN